MDTPLPGHCPDNQQVQIELSQCAARLASATAFLTESTLPLTTTPQASTSSENTSDSGCRLDDPETLSALAGLADPAAERLTDIANVVSDLATGQISEAAAVEGLRHLAAQQTVRHRR